MGRLDVGPYAVLMVAGILLTGWIWARLAARRGRHDARLSLIYFAGLFGALLGAKLAFLLAEGWWYRESWVALVSGRSITGGLLGGYVAVEIAKKVLRYQRITGDLFAAIVPIGLAVGRVGCLLQGCCPGIECEAHWWTTIDDTGAPRWPAAAVEGLFQLAFLVWVLVARKRGWLRGNHFHVYLIAYGIFRFGHEFARDDHTMLGRIGGYHVLALVLVGLGVWRLVQRRALQQTRRAQDEEVGERLGPTSSEAT